MKGRRGSLVGRSVLGYGDVVYRIDVHPRSGKCIINNARKTRLGRELIILANMSAVGHGTSTAGLSARRIPPWELNMGQHMAAPWRAVHISPPSKAAVVTFALESWRTSRSTVQ